MFQVAELFHHDAGVDLHRARMLARSIAGTSLNRVVLIFLQEGSVIPAGILFGTDGLHNLSHFHRIARWDLLERDCELFGGNSGNVLKHRP